MATQMQQAREGRITDAMKLVAAEEHIPAETIRERVANGTIAICANINHENLRPRGVGEGLRVKVNANIGTSSTFPDIEPELGTAAPFLPCEPGELAFHLQEDFVLGEVIDPQTGEPAEAAGELVLTTLLAEAMPLVRLRTGLYVEPIPAPCTCGRTMRRFRLVLP